MKSFSKNKGPGRKPKFLPGEVVNIRGGDSGVVVDWKSDNAGRGFYRVIRLLSLNPHRRVGPAIWFQSYMLGRKWNRPRADRSRSVYNVNERLIERGCSCQCCPHVALHLSDVSNDGTFAWEGE